MPVPTRDPRNTQGKMCPVCRARGASGLDCAWALQYTGEISAFWTTHQTEHDVFLADEAGGHIGESTGQVVQTPASEEQLAAFQAEAERDLKVWLDAFIGFPVGENRQGVIDRLDAFQYAWMNRRAKCPS